MLTFEGGLTDFTLHLLPSVLDIIVTFLDFELDSNPALQALNVDVLDWSCAW